MQENKFLQWMTQNTQSIYWHDSAILAEQQEAFANGATGMTTNPFLINATLSSNREVWADRLAELPKDLSGDEKVLALVHCVTGYYSDVTRPIFDHGETGKGYVCAQVNPNKTGDVSYMVEQAKKLSSWAPNIVVKLPATNAGIQAYEECAALGINVAATVSFTVPQVLAAAEAAERGKKRAVSAGIKPGLSIAVLMEGRLDDYLRDVAHDNGAAVSEQDIVLAGLACIKRAYGIFQERGYSTFLMPAGCRGPHHISELAGAKMIMSVSPKIAKALASNTVFEPRIDAPVDAAAIERLLTMAEFRKAYEPDGMKPEEFITFGSANRTTDQFINDGWNPLVNFKF